MSILSPLPHRLSQCARRIARALVVLGCAATTVLERTRAGLAASPFSRSVLARTLLVVSLCSAATALLVARGVQPPPPGPYDAIVVAGCRVLPGGRPSRALARRAELAADLFAQGFAPRVVFTGGVGQHGPSEASVAAAHAVASGLPRWAYSLEERSTSTRENAEGAARLLGRDARVLVVTDAYHVFRARRVFAGVFAQAEGAGVPPAEEALAYALPRELAAVVIYAVRGDLRARR